MQRKEILQMPCIFIKKIYRNSLINFSKNKYKLPTRQQVKKLQLPKSLIYLLNTRISIKHQIFILNREALIHLPVFVLTVYYTMYFSFRVVCIVKLSEG